MQIDSPQTHGAPQQGTDESQAHFVSQWTVSTYMLNTISRTQAAVHVEHPNKMGSDNHTGLLAERARLKRFRGRYIFPELHDAATGRTKGTSSFLFRRSAGADFLAQCAKKRCFRMQNLSFSPPPVGAPLHVNDAVRHAVDTSLSTLEKATSLYGPDVTSDIQLGFSKPIPLHELRDPNSELPLVADYISTERSIPAPEDVLSVVVSYRHTTQKLGYILNVELAAWPEIASTAATLCEATGRTAVRLWTDQILSRRKPSATMRWVSSGVLPYAIYPVLYVHSDAAQLQRSLRRMWISVEHLMASFGQGLVHSGRVLDGDDLPKEWPTNYVRVGSNVTWMLGLGNPLPGSVRKLSSALMCGLVRNKQMSWPGDAQDLLDWASAITSALLFQDIAHSFNCSDCREPLGYTSGQRLMALFSSGVAIAPRDPNVLFNGAHPRLDVPAVSLEYDGRTWDGFREWVPESCLWGLKGDESKEEVAVLMNGVRALVTSYGGSQGLAILQFTSSANQDTVLITAHLLVGLMELRQDARQASVEWSKRFWPVYPLQAWKSFEAVWRDVNDREAFVELGETVSASSGIAASDLTGATVVQRLTGKQIRWR